MIKVVIADDSTFLRQVLKDMLTANHINVVAEAKNGKEAVACVKTFKPDLLILDCEMPVMSGLDALGIIMKQFPLPVIMFSALTWEGASVTIKALELGAIDFVTKPVGGVKDIEEIKNELLDKIRLILFKAETLKMVSRTDLKLCSEKSKERLKKIEKSEIQIIAMGSSTGGVQAAIEVIPNLPEDCPPIVWVQHMPENFTKSFSSRLNSLSKIKVKEAEDGELIKKGICYLAKGGIQMKIVHSENTRRIKLGDRIKVNGHCPSCDVLFESVNENYGNKALGVIFTGMGDDGTKGLIKMHNSGAYVIGQSETSCVVYGMPKAAFQAGAVDVLLDVKDIAEGIKKVTGIY